jgi:LuxR family maltose regulon positive regulatory protein
MPLLTTKLVIPPVRPGLVLRLRLVGQLEPGGYPKLTLVSAPAGFGKTTLLSAWARHQTIANRAVRIAWLSLDESDSDPVRFFAYLIAALHGADPQVGLTAQTLLEASQPVAGEAICSSLINDVAAAPAPVALVLDDYHLVRNQAIHQWLGFLVDHQPTQLHVIVATREDPPLPLSKLRGRGQLSEIRQADLQFTVEEAAGFFSETMEMDLTTSEVVALHRRTEGWIAGLQLAATSLRGRHDISQAVQSFAGSNRYILDYLMDQVFEQQAASVQDFLLKTAVLDRLTPSLCDDVIARTDSATTLLALEKSNLFLIRLDESQNWYRYHRLFAELLRHRLQVTGTRELIRSLHGRASAWFERQGQLAEAIEHALRGEDWGRAARLLRAEAAEFSKRGEITTLLRYFRSLPEELVRADELLAHEYGWALILTDQLEAGEELVAAAEAASGDDPAMPGNVAAARAYIARARGDNQAAVRLSEQALALLPRESHATRGIVALNLGITRWFMGQLPECERVLAEAARATLASGNRYAHFAALVFQSRTEAARGRLRAAATIGRRIIAEGPELPVTSLAHIDLAKTLYEWNDLEPAAEHLEQGLSLAQRSSISEYQVTGYMLLGLVRQVQGHQVAAREARAQAWTVAERADVSLTARAQALAYEILVLLAAGEVEEAAALVDRLPSADHPEPAPTMLLTLLARARLLLAQGELAAAADVLAAQRALVKRSGWTSALIQTLALQALAARTRDEQAALLGGALAAAAQEGYVRSLLDGGAPMQQLLWELAAIGRLPAYGERLLGLIGTPMSGEPTADAGAAAGLTERELEVLRLLAAGRTNREIAQALYISINTVKSHLKNVYAKLEVGNRRQAVSRATHLHLIG